MELPTRPRRWRPILAVAAAMLAIAGSTLALSSADPGAEYEHQLQAESMALYGFGKPLATSATSASSTLPGPDAVSVAAGLKVSLVSDRVADNADMIALWPNDTNPTYSIICNEINGAPAGSPATVQRVRLSDGQVSDMVYGLTSCDPAHRTAWGTIIIGEEAGAVGRLWEILDPLSVSGVQVNRAAGTSSDPAHVVARTAVGQLSFEGIVGLPDGTLYYGDELRPSAGKAGGGIYKFIPSAPFAGGAPIASLASSPLAAGSVSVMRLGIRNDFSDYGQGSNIGAGRWVLLTTPADPTTWNLGAAAQAAGMTGYYRPEDMDLDPLAWAQGNTRMCWNNTGNDAAE
ncbi:MAG: PhoX family protein, partial [Chloroflexota bacterium]|nr:PhoX family protein [Chloroflexota bacterium]